MNSEQFYSQWGQDEFVAGFFRHKHSGVFIEAGAHDGKSKSNTYYLEKELGWTGLLIEPIPDVFQRLKNNRSGVCINGCLSAEEGTMEFLCLTGYTQMLSGLVGSYHPAHLERIDRELDQFGGSKTVIEVKTYNVNDLLEQNDFSRVDYLSLDTEGNELDILKTINFDQRDITLIGVENNYSDDALKHFLIERGFRLIGRKGDDFFLNEKFADDFRDQLSSMT